MNPIMITTSNWLVELLLGVSLKAILLALLAAAGMWLFQVRTASVRHRVWTAVLGGMLLMPVLVAWTPAVPLPTWAYPSFQLAGPHEMLSDLTINEPATPTPITKETQSFESIGASPKISAAPSTPFVEQIPSTATIAPSATNWTNYGATLLIACYAIGAAILGCRLLIGVLAARRLVRSARPLKLPPEQAAELGTTRVFESLQVRVPLTVGWVHPAILLPSDWSSWTAAMLAMVLAHEQAHVRRRDLWVALLAQANRAIYWFHPLAWLLVRRLTALAEAASDDAVIESLGDRTAYARHLLTIASRLSAHRRRFEPLGVCMAARPVVEDRIEAILDERRPLARRVGWIGSLVVLAAIVPAAFLTAGITADNSRPEAEVEPPVALASDTGRQRLTVLDDNDAPVPGANVKVRVRQVFMGQDTYTHHQTDKAGRLEVAVPKPTPYYMSAHVSLPGYAPFLAEWENHDTPDPIPAEYTVRLDTGRMIGGIVRDANGEPIEGVSVRPQFNIKLREERTRQMGSGESVKTNAAGEWTYASLPTDLQQVPLHFRHAAHVQSRVTEPVAKVAIPVGGHPSAVTTMKQGIVFGGRVTDAEGTPIDGATVTYIRQGSGDSPTATTDKDGRYRFRNGETGAAVLTVAKSNLAPAMKALETLEEMEAINFQLTSGSPLHVRVLGPDQKPLEGAYVSLWNWDEQGVYGSLPDSRGKTDASGQWQWAHAPHGSLRFAVSHAGYRYTPGVAVTPGEENVIIMSRQSAETIEGHTLKFSGRVSDAETNARIPRFRVTAGHQRKAGGTTYWLQDTQSKGRDGVYRRELTSKSVGLDVYAIALRVESDGYRPAVIEQVIAGKQDFKADVALEKAANDGFRVLMPDGEAAAGATVAVCTPDVGPMVQDGRVISNSSCERTITDKSGRFSITPQKGLFDLLVLHDSGAAYVTPKKLTDSHTISLEPWARVEGTLRVHGQPAASESIRLDRADSPLMKAPKIFYQYETKTDQDGKFSFERVVPGSGRVARVAVSQLGGGMSRSTPTIASGVTFKPGETAHVELGRLGRQVVGKLVMPADAKPGNDWRLAMLTLRSRPRNAPNPPKVSFPPGIDPQKDQDAARIWWEQWRLTDAGKVFQKEMKRYAEAVKGFKPVNFSGRAEPDGTFTFDDIPAGDYELNAQAFATSPGHAGFFGDMIGNLNHSLVVPESSTRTASEPVNLGELTLKASPSP